MYKHAYGALRTPADPSECDCLLEPVSRFELLATGASGRAWDFVWLTMDLMIAIAERGCADCAEMAACLNGLGHRTALDTLWNRRLVRIFAGRNNLKNLLTF